MVLGEFMKNTLTSHDILHRTVPVAIGCVVLMTLMLARLVEVQLIRSAEFREQADGNRFFTQLLPKERGIIFDRYGQRLVQNAPVYYKLADAERIFNTEELIDRSEALQLMSTASAQVQMKITRQYPLGAAGAGLLGYVGPVTAEDIARDRSLSPRDVIGKMGLERTFDVELQGEQGTRKLEITALGTKNRVITELPGAPGSEVHTTLDPYLTQRAYEALSDLTGAVIITSADTGELLSVVSTPSFDPSLLTERYADRTLETLRRQQVQQLFTDERQLFFNRAFGGAYPPGSVFKLVTALAGLETEALNAETTVLDEGVLTVGEYSYGNWYYSQYGRVEGEVALARALARSNDIYFYKAAEWIGPDRLAEFARQFGLGSRTGIELAGESAGFVPTTAWKEETLGERWYLGNTYHFGIGQGDLLVTPLQVAQMTQAIGSGGVRCQPTVTQHEAYDCSGLGLADGHVDTVLEGMLDACSAGGTAYPFFSWNETHRNTELPVREQIMNSAVACKTGTAEFGGVTELNKRKTHGWFTMVMGTSFIPRAVSDTESAEATEASQSAELTVAENERVASSAARLEESTQTEYQEWLELVAEHGFPEKIIITVLVESDEAEPYREGSSAAAPVAAAVVKWMESGAAVIEAKEASQVKPASGEVLAE